MKQTVDNKMNLNDIDVPDQFRSKVKRLFLENKDLFASKDSELSHTDIVKMQVDVGDHQPIKMRRNRTPLKDRE